MRRRHPRQKGLICSTPLLVTSMKRMLCIQWQTSMETYCNIGVYGLMQMEKFLKVALSITSMKTKQTTAWKTLSYVLDQAT